MGWLKGLARERRYPTDRGTRTRIERERERDRVQRGRGRGEREGTKRKSTTSTVATRKFDFQIGVARTSGQRGRVRRTGHGGRGVVNTRNPSKSRRCVPSWRSCVGGRECALEKGKEGE